MLNGRARPDACSSAALATISALSASFSARVRLRAGFSTTTSFPFLFSRPISNKQFIEHLASVWREDAADAAAAWSCCGGVVLRLWRGRRRARQHLEHGGARGWRDGGAGAGDGGCRRRRTVVRVARRGTAVRLACENGAGARRRWQRGCTAAVWKNGGGATGRRRGGGCGAAAA